MKLNPGTQIGPYRVEALLGQGGMAAVYKVWHTELHRFEAMKIPLSASLDGEFASRFLQEARHAALQHPHIVAIHNVSTPNETQRYFTMELIEGGDLAGLIFERKQLSLEETGMILQQVADALDFAHSRGVIHRDIKPSNILLQQTRNGLFAKVMDFGISRAIDTDATTRLTKTGTFIGTPEYMSPEQAGSGAVVDHHTDQYSLAIIAYEMLCGRPPFRAESSTSMLSVIIKHVRDLPPAPNVLTPSLAASANDAILKALSKEPENRFDSCAAFVNALMESVTVPSYPAVLAPVTTSNASAEIATISGESPPAATSFDITKIGNHHPKNGAPASELPGNNIASPSASTTIGKMPPPMPTRKKAKKASANVTAPAPDSLPTAAAGNVSAKSRGGGSHLLRNVIFALLAVGAIAIVLALMLRKPTIPARHPNTPPPPVQTLSFPDGSHYEGPVVDGKMEGTGNQTWPDGRHYGGSYKNGLKDGHGTMTWPDGKSVEAIWANDKVEKVLLYTPPAPKHVRGEKIFPDKSHYWGDLLQGKMDGEGTLKWPDKSTFKGHFVNGAIMGAGTLTWQDKKATDTKWTDAKVKSTLAGWKAQAAKKAAKAAKTTKAPSPKPKPSSPPTHPVAPPPI